MGPLIRKRATVTEIIITLFLQAKNIRLAALALRRPNDIVVSIRTGQQWRLSVQLFYSSL